MTFWESRFLQFSADLVSVIQLQGITFNCRTSSCYELLEPFYTRRAIMVWILGKLRLCFNDKLVGVKAREIGTDDKK